MKYKVGMKVKCIKNVTNYNTKNKIGRIIYMDSNLSYPYAIEFDEFMGTCMDCCGRGRYGHCLWVKKDDIIPYNSKQRIK